MAASTFNALANPARARAISAGTKPAERVNPEVVTAMREVGVEHSGTMPRKLTFELAARAQQIITMGCGDDCPVVPGAKREDWPLDDPKGKTLDEVREIRESIRLRVEQLIEREDWR